MRPRKTQTQPTITPAPSPASLAAFPFMDIPGLPAIEPLTVDTFGALPKKKVSSLCNKADGRGGDALRARLAPLTNCASYLVCIGSLGFATRRSYDVVEPKLWLALSEAIFAYQLDWRYPKPFGITMTGLDEAAPDAAFRRAYPYVFFNLIERSPSYFMSGSAQPAASYMVTLTQHLLGKQAAVYEVWLDQLIMRLTEVAHDPAPDASRSIHAYPSREAWEAAVRVTHGLPLPLELLDVSTEMPSQKDWPALVAATFARLSPDTNPLLQPKVALIERGLATPYAT